MTIEEIEKLIQNGAKRECNKCGITKSVSDFYIKKCKNNKLNRFNSPCKKCSYENDKRVYMKNYSRKRNFGISADEFNDMKISQDDKCAICKKDSKYFKRDFSIDHCHTTGKIRGLLCSNCNTGIGMFKDDIDILKSAILYLKSS